MPRIPNPSFVFPAPALKRDSSPPPLPLRSPARDELVSLSIRQKQERSISSLPASESARPFSAVILDPLSTFLLDSPVEALDIPPALRPSPRSSNLWHDAPEFADDCSKADSQHLFLLAAHHRTRPSTCTNFSHRSSIRSDIEAQIALCDEDPHSHCDPVDLCDELLGHPSRHMDDETVPLVSSPRTDTNLPSPAKDTPVLRRTRRSSKLDYFHWKKPSIVQEPDLTTIPESTLDSSRATDTRRHGTVFHIPHRPYNISAKNMESLHLRDDALNRLEGRVDQTCDLSLAPSSLSQLKGYFVRQNLTVDTQAPAQKTEAPPEVPIDSAYHSAGPSKVSKGSVTTLVNSSGVPSAIPSSTEAMHRHSTSVSSIKSTCSEWLARHARDTGVQMAEKAGAASQQKRQPSRNMLSERAVNRERRAQCIYEYRKKQEPYARLNEPEEDQSGIRKLLSRLKGKHILKKTLKKSSSMTNLLWSKGG